MTMNEVIAFITELPWWAWLGVFFVFLMLIGDRKLWEYEVKFPLREGIGRGKVELKSLKKKGTMIEISLQLEQSYRNKDVAVYLNNNLIHTVASEKNSGDYISVEQQVEISEPKEADDIAVKINGDVIFSGQLVLD